MQINLDWLEEALHGLGIWGPLIVILLRAGAALLAIVPSSPVLLAAGALYGLLWGTILVLIGAELGCLAAFLIGRSVGYDFVARRGWLAALSRTRPGRWLLEDKASQSRLMMAVFCCRLVPGINLDAVSYVAGVTPITTWRFCLATFAGLFPYTLLLVGVGREIMRVSTMQAFLILLLVLAMVFLVPAIWKFARRRKHPVVDA
jgi:uncharacterized membrane protein YdjX (TVP38/TMEM64 family)